MARLCRDHLWFVVYLSVGCGRLLVYSKTILKTSTVENSLILMYTKWMYLKRISRDLVAA
jgi:hypothetical protein